MKLPRPELFANFIALIIYATSPQINAAEISHLPSNDQDKQGQPRVINLVVHPAAESSMPMRYPLLPPLADRHSGNAAIRYHRAIEELPTREEDMKKVNDWLELPLEKMPMKEVTRCCCKVSGSSVKWKRAHCCSRIAIGSFP